MLRDLSQDSLVDLLFELELQGRSIEIAISGCDSPGRLTLSNGRLVHAECGSVQGRGALDKILRVRQGRYELLETPLSTQRTLDLPIAEAVAPSRTQTPVSTPPRLASESKTLLSYATRPISDPAPATAASEGNKRPSDRSPGMLNKTLLGTGYSSAPPPAWGEERVTLPRGVRSKATPERVLSIGSGTLAGGTGSLLPEDCGPPVVPSPSVRVSEPPDTGPVPSAALDRTSLDRLGELNEAISSTRHPAPARGAEEPDEWAAVGPESAEQTTARVTQEGLPRVGRYEVLARLKSGGMGSIYLCRLSGNAGFQRLFAMKVLHEHLVEQPEALDLFFSEARLLAQLHHPNIVGVVDVGAVEQPYLVLDYVEGGSLHELLRASSNNLSPGVVLSIVLDALQGLSAAHQLTSDNGKALGLVHNDISPQNLLVGVDGTCRVTDFGVARTRGGSLGSMPTRGKPSYVAPERLLEQPFDHRADIFSVGVVLYQALTGVDPFLGASPEETLRNVLEHPVQPPSEVGLRPPPALDWICMRALARSPHERFQSAEEMANHLRRVAAREDLLVAPSAVAHAVRTTLAVTLEARRGAAQRGALTEVGRRRASTMPPGVHGLAHDSQEDPLGSEPPPSSGEFGDRTEILSAPPAARREKFRNIVMYAALVLAAGALVLVVFFPEHVQRVLRKQPPRPLSTEEAMLTEETVLPAPAPDDSESPAVPSAPEVSPDGIRLPPIEPSQRARP